MKRIVNFRFFLFLAIGLMFGIFSFCYSYCQKNYWLFSIISLLIIIGLVLCILFKYRKIVMITLLVGVFLGAILSGIQFVKYNNQIEEGNYYLQAKVDSISQTGQSYCVVLTDVIDFKDNTKISGNILVYQFINNFNYDLKEGNIVKFTGDLEKSSLINYGKINTYNFKHKVKYQISLNESNFDIIDYKPSLVLKIKNHIKQIYEKNLDGINSSIAFSSLFADKSLMEDINYELFSSLGMAHILAVSGLHIGFMVVLLQFLLKKLKVKNTLNFIICGILLFLYIAICEFSLSSVRAFIMAMVLSLSNLLYNRYDNLSSLGLACSIILILTPFSLFDVGFLLTVSSVLGILCLSPMLINLLDKIKLPKSFSSLIAVTISAQIATFPIIASVFKEINLLSFVLNLIIIPLFEVYFIALVIITILVGIFGFLGFLFIIPEILCNTYYVIMQLSKMYFSLVISLQNIGIFAGIMFFILLFFVSKFVMIPFKPKLIISMFMMAIILIFALINPYMYNIKNLNKTNINFIGGASNCFIINNYGKTYIVNVGNTGEGYKLVKYIEKMNLYDIEALIFTRYTSSELNTVKEIDSICNIESIYLPNDLDIDIVCMKDLLASFDNLVFFEEETQVSNIIIQEFKNESGSGVYFKINNFSLFLVNSGNSSNANFIEYINDIGLNFDILKIYGYTNVYKNENFLNNIIVCERFYVEKSYETNVYCNNDYNILLCNLNKKIKMEGEK